jgi:hypothetical protein
LVQASINKRASLKDHERMLVQDIHIPDGRFIIIFTSIFGVIIFMTGKFRTHLRPK